MPTGRLPAKPNIEHLRHQARDLLEDREAAERQALQRIREFHPRFRGMTDGEIRIARFTLSDAYLTIAREYGFATWARLSTHVRHGERSKLERPHHERIADLIFRRAVELLDDGNLEGLKRHLTEHPDVVRQRVHFDGENYFRDPSLLEFAAENPVRHDSLPPNIVEVVRAILDAGARADRRAIDSTLALVSSGRVSREAGVQIELIDLLCDCGGDPQGAITAALGHGEFQAAEALICRGARMTLPVAAAMGRLDAARASLPHATPEERHFALAWAAQHGHPEIVRLLLNSGEDPNRYNPPGAHSHSTPLHQAAWAGHESVVRLLVERGARTDIRDIQYHGTPLNWAEHAGRDAVVAYLREQGR